MSPPPGSALDLAVSYLLRIQRPDGSLRGHMDGGALFNAASVIVSRARPPRSWVLDEIREVQLAEYLAAVQLPGGLFSAYPGGRASLEATRISALALGRVLESNGLLKESVPASRERIVSAHQRALAALEVAPGGTMELHYQRALRVLLEALDGRCFEARRALLAAPSKLARIFTGLGQDRLDGVVFPFITVLAPMLTLLGIDAEEESSGLLPRLARWLNAQDARALVRFLLERQDGSGGFFYSSLYTQLFITALEAVPVQWLGDELTGAVRRAVERAAAYIQVQDVETKAGRAVRLLGSELWDSVSTGIALLREGVPRVPDEVLQRLTLFVLEDQRPDGGWSFGEQARFTDCDTTSWALTFLIQLRQSGRCPALHERCAAAAIAAFDFLGRRVGPSGGFGAWGKNQLWKRRGTVGEMSSIFLDLPAEEPTGRAMMAFGELKSLYATSPEFRRQFGIERSRLLARLCDGAFAFLRAQRDPKLGLWPARWCVGFLPGTAFILTGLSQHRYPELPQWRHRAGQVVLQWQNADGGWGESKETDQRGCFLPGSASTLLHSVSALNILNECGYGPDHPVFRRGLEYVAAQQREDGSFVDDSVYTCFTGFYCRYDLMSQALGITALALERRGALRVAR